MKIAPGEFLARVNATPLGKVISERTLRRHRQELGSDASDVDVGLYLAHLAERFQRKQEAAAAATYEDKKEKARERSKKVSFEGRDCGPLPEVCDPDRKEACRHDLKLFLEQYLADVFLNEWSDDHIKVIAAMQETILTGAQFALAMPRGSGKTSLTEGAAIWAILYGHRRFVVIIGSDAEAAGELLESVKTQFEHNETLYEDFPEVCHPIRALEGITHRCKGQLFNGESTAIKWQTNQVIFPTIPGSAASGAVIKVRGLTGRIRGMKHITAAGESLRPDFVILDDPQTDESAFSLDQTNKRERTIAGAVLGLAGPGKSVAAVMLCTIIAHNDLAHRLLDREKNPEWHGIRTQLMYALPTDLALWEKYFEILDEDLRNDRGRERATAFYKKNRKKMDAGAKPAWLVRYEPKKGEISAIQHAMHLRHKNEYAFLAEYQNDPPDEMADDGTMLTVDQICEKISGYLRNEIPPDTEYVVAGVDVQLHALYFLVLALSSDFTPTEVDYGAWPKQPTKYFTYTSIPVKIDQIKVEGVPLSRRKPEARLRYALEALVNNDLMLRKFERDDGSEMEICRCLIDYGYYKNVVFKFVRESPHKARLYPAKGEGRGADQKLISEAKPKPGERIGEEWIIPKADSKRSVRFVHFDSNYWKTFAHDRISTPIGESGSFTFHKAKQVHHKMVAEHLTGEYRIRMTAEKAGRTKDIWKEKPNRDNHLLDCCNMALVGGSIEGATIEERDQGPRPQGRKKRSGGMKLSEMRARKRWGG